MHMDKSVSNNDILMYGMTMFRQDQKKYKGGGCAIYCRNNPASHSPKRSEYVRARVN